MSYVGSGTHTVEAYATDKYGYPVSKTWTFTVTAPPQIDQLAPVDNSILKVSPATISAKVSDLDGIDQSSLKLTVDGQFMTLSSSPSITYTSTSSNGGISTAGIVSWSPPAYTNSDNRHNIKIEVKDNKGTYSSKDWSFIVYDDDLVAPRIYNLAPANGSTIYEKTTVSAKIVDYNGLNINTIRLTLNGNLINYTYTPIDSNSGIITAPLIGYTEGIYALGLSASDTGGNPAAATWSFTLKKCIHITSVEPTGYAKAGLVPIYSRWEDEFTNHDMDDTYTFMEVTYPDNTKVSYNGSSTPNVYSWYGSDGQCCGETYYHQLIEGLWLNLTAPGTYTVTSKAKDKLGNENSYTWSFNVAGPPTISQLTPANNSTFTDTPPSIISAKVTDPAGIDPSSIQLYVGSVLRPHTYNAETGIVSWDSCSLPPSTSPYYVTLIVKNSYGLSTSTSWNFKVNNNPPVIDQQTPANGSAAKVSPSVISARVTDRSGINESSIKLYVNGSLRNYAYDPVTGIVSWIPESPFSPSANPYPVTLEVKDSYGSTNVSNWNFYVHTGPELVEKSSYTNYPDTYVTAKFYDPYGFGTPAYLKLNGQVVAWDYDGYGSGGGCCDPYIPPADPTHATLKGNIVNLPDGEYNAEAQVTDALGFSEIFNWKFDVKVGPKVSDYPKDSVVTTNQYFTFKVIDPQGDQIDPNSIVIYENYGLMSCTTTYDPATGIVTVRPLVPFTEGWHRWGVSVSDVNGNPGGATFIATVYSEKPQFLFEGEGKTFYPGEPLDLKVDIKDFNAHIVKDSCSLKIDGNPIDARIMLDNKENRTTTVEGYPFGRCLSGNSAEGTLKYQGYYSLSPGTHELTATANDIYGNVGTQTWQFKVDQTVITDVKPQGIVVDPSPTVEAKINTSEIPVDKESIKMVVDKATVQPQIVEENGSLKLKYTSATLADNRYHEVTLTVNDANHFRHSKSWKFCASPEPFPVGLSKPTPAQGAVNNGGKEPITVVVNNSNETMDLANTNITFTQLTSNGYPVNKTYQGVVDVLGLPPVQKLTGWYKVDTASVQDSSTLEWRQVPEHRPGLDSPLAEGNWKVTVNVPNKANANAPYTLTWNFTVGEGSTQGQAPAPGVLYGKPSGTTVSKKPTIMAGFTQVTLNSATKWVELFVDGQKINENVISNTAPYQDGLANIYTNPPSIVYKPATDLAEGSHTVSARCYNVATGETITSKEWIFTVETTNLGPTDGTMDITSNNSVYNQTCWGCHGTVGKREKARIQTFYHITDSACLQCHKALNDWEREALGITWNYLDLNIQFSSQSHPIPRVSCTGCHEQTNENITTSVMREHPENLDCAICHKGDGTITIIPDILNKNWMNNCVSCHYEVEPVKVTANHDGAPEFNVSGKINHNIDDGHLSDTKGCTSCHSRILTKEHARPGRTDKQGQPINCMTCHDPQYQNITGRWDGNEKLAVSGVSATLTRTNQVVQKVYYPPKGKRITAWQTTPSETYFKGPIPNTGVEFEWRIYALANGEWVQVHERNYSDGGSYTMGALSYNNKVDGADALMILGQTNRFLDSPATLATPLTVQLTEVTLTTTASNRVWNTIVEGKSSCTDCHGEDTHPGEHTSQLDTFCLGCHKDNLIKEHMDNPKTQKGNFFTCDTCHKDNDRKVKPDALYTVKDAIANHKRLCQDCHGSIDHDKQHEFDLGPECKTCHQLALTKEHMSNTKTQTKSLDCNTCHNSTGNKIVRSIQNNSLYCGGCHQNAKDTDGSGHNVTFADRVPADIPLHPDFKWSNPEDADLYVGEPGLPAGYQLGQVVISNRQKKDINVLWSYYNDELTAKEWSFKSKVDGTDRFSAEFAKEGRYVTIKCFKNEHSDGTGPLIDEGYRIEIWYTPSKPN